MASSSSSSVAMTLERRRRQQQQQHQPSSLLQRFFTRSTIYNRHEQRRARTLATHDDTRPAAVRILAQLSMTRSNESSVHHRAAQPQPELGGEVGAVLPDDDTTTVFDTYDVESSSSSSSTTCPPPVPPLIVAVSAAVGAQVAQLATPFGLPQQPPPPLSRATTTNIVLQGESLVLLPPSSSTAPTTTTTRRVVVPPRRPIALLASTPRTASQRATTTTTPVALLRKLLTRSPLTPCVVLFGTQAWVESQILSSWTTTTTSWNGTNHNHQPPPPPLFSLASLTASGVAGAAVGVLSGATRVSGHAGAAMVYFGTFQFLQRAMGGGPPNSQPQPSSWTRNDWWTTGGAGAVAGSLYEVLRQELFVAGRRTRSSSSWLVAPRTAPTPFATTTATTVTAAQRRILPLVVRAAPTHALLFVGMEAAQRWLLATTTN
eukprot:CAMPEP_0168732790 /NCGR_PEP_ID=MMETSP0724-20121128/7949_1 /TAXON_ID=265536 /ORGANISM="Amphiprora sp., Strain CCMP467" /LENGTH=431 /DNA_ID=CAMNT_0008779813 /DNA_START=93 /DNA_END=1388 /DNA_ORIENTATION=-